jgi:hypothetical protein
VVTKRLDNDVVTKRLDNDRVTKCLGNDVVTKRLDNDGVTMHLDDVGVTNRLDIKGETGFVKMTSVHTECAKKVKCSKPPGLGCQECFIGTVQSASRWRPTGTGEVTVDSAAEESVCPKSWGQQFPVRRPSRWMRFVNASGGVMNHYGEKLATIRTEAEGDVMSLGFQVSDVSKPLLAVWRIAEKGNRIQFGPEEKDNFIENVRSGKRVMMKRKGGSYVIPAELVVEESGFARPVKTP